MIAEKIVRQTLELKIMVQRSMSSDEAERATGSLNAILAEAERVRGLEQAAILPEGELS